MNMNMQYCNPQQMLNTAQHNMMKPNTDQSSNNPNNNGNNNNNTNAMNSFYAAGNPMMYASSNGATANPYMQQNVNHPIMVANNMQNNTNINNSNPTAQSHFDPNSVNPPMNANVNTSNAHYTGTANASGPTSGGTSYKSFIKQANSSNRKSGGVDNLSQKQQEGSTGANAAKQMMSQSNGQTGTAAIPVTAAATGAVASTGVGASVPSNKQKKIIVKHADIIKKKRQIKIWTIEEDELLKQLCEQLPGKWGEIANQIPSRNASQCSQRWRRILPTKVRKPWTNEEDLKVLELSEKYGKNWGMIAQHIDGKTGKQVRERYINKLDPTIKRSPWSEEEDQKILDMFLDQGPKWSAISNELVGRPENTVKNRFYSHISRIYLSDDSAYQALKNSDNNQKIKDACAKLPKSSNGGGAATAAANSKKHNINNYSGKQVKELAEENEDDEDENNDDDADEMDEEDNNEDDDDDDDAGAACDAEDDLQQQQQKSNNVAQLPLQHNPAAVAAAATSSTQGIAPVVVNHNNNIHHQSQGTTTHQQSNSLPNLFADINPAAAIASAKPTSNLDLLKRKQQQQQHLQPNAQLPMHPWNTNGAAAAAGMNIGGMHPAMPPPQTSSYHVSMINISNSNIPTQPAMPHAHAHAPVVSDRRNLKIEEQEDQDEELLENPLTDPSKHDNNNNNNNNNNNINHHSQQQQQSNNLYPNYDSLHQQQQHSNSVYMTPNHNSHHAGFDNNDNTHMAGVGFVAGIGGTAATTPATPNASMAQISIVKTPSFSQSALNSNPTNPMLAKRGKISMNIEIPKASSQPVIPQYSNIASTSAAVSAAATISQQPTAAGTQQQSQINTNNSSGHQNNVSSANESENNTTHLTGMMSANNLDMMAGQTPQNYYSTMGGLFANSSQLTPLYPGSTLQQQMQFQHHHSHQQQQHQQQAQHNSNVNGNQSGNSGMNASGIPMEVMSPMFSTTLNSPHMAPRSTLPLFKPPMTTMGNTTPSAITPLMPNGYNSYIVYAPQSLGMMTPSAFQFNQMRQPFYLATQGQSVFPSLAKIGQPQQPTAMNEIDKNMMDSQDQQTPSNNQTFMNMMSYPQAQPVNHHVNNSNNNMNAQQQHSMQSQQNQQAMNMHMTGAATTTTTTGYDLTDHSQMQHSHLQHHQQHAHQFQQLQSSHSHDSEAHGYENHSQQQYQSNNLGGENGHEKKSTLDHLMKEFSQLDPEARKRFQMMIQANSSAGANNEQSNINSGAGIHDTHPLSQMKREPHQSDYK